MEIWCQRIRWFIVWAKVFDAIGQLKIFILLFHFLLSIEKLPLFLQRMFFFRGFSGDGRRQIASVGRIAICICLRYFQTINLPFSITVTTHLISFNIFSFARRRSGRKIEMHIQSVFESKTSRANAMNFGIFRFSAGASEITAHISYSFLLLMGFNPGESYSVAKKCACVS